MEIVKQVLTWIDIIVMVAFIGLVAIQTSRAEGIFTPGATEGTYIKAKPGFKDNLSRLTLILAITIFVLTAVVYYLP